MANHSKLRELTEEIETQTLYQLLKSIRGNDSLREAANKTGLSHAFIKVLESGVDPRSNTPISPSPDTLRAYAKGYGVPYQELMEKAGYLTSGFADKDAALEQVCQELRRVEDLVQKWTQYRLDISAYLEKILEHYSDLQQENEQLREELERAKGRVERRAMAPIKARHYDGGEEN